MGVAGSPGHGIHVTLLGCRITYPPTHAAGMFESSNPRIWLGFNGQTVYSDLCALGFFPFKARGRQVEVVIVVVDVDVFCCGRNSISESTQTTGAVNGVFIGSKWECVIIHGMLEALVGWL